MSNETSSGGETDWLDEWEQEQKLSPEDAHVMLTRTFAERLDAWRRTHPDEDSWIIPFHYEHEDLKDAERLQVKGGLWIPPEEIQGVINRFGSYIHMSAVIDMESALYGTGIDVAPLSQCSRLDLSGEVPVAFVPSYHTVSSVLREQVQHDFGVIIRSS